MRYLPGGGSRGQQFGAQGASTFFAGPVPSFRTIADADGSSIWIALAPNASARNVIQPTGISTCPLATKAMSGQTANLFEWQNSSGSAIAAINPAGRLMIGNGGSTLNGHIQGPSSMAIAFGQSWGSGTLTFQNGPSIALILDIGNNRMQCNLASMLFNYSFGATYLGNIQSQPLGIKFGSTETARFATSGSLLVGTTTDQARFTAYGAGTSTGMTAYFAGSTGIPSLQLRDDGAWCHGNNTPTATQTGYTAFANLTTKRTVDVSTASLADVANILGTLVQDLKTKGIIAS